jgi:sulfite exporter TauE/SafE
MNVDLLPWLLAALVTGFSGSPHCVGMCGGFVAAVGKDIPSLIFWHMGRLTTYMILGGMAGVIGERLPGPGWLPSVLSGGFLIFFALSFAGFLRPVHLRVPGLSNWISRWMRRPGYFARWIFGILIGLLPCGLTWSALSMPVASGSGVGGALVMLVFGLGTLPVLSLGSLSLHKLSRYRGFRPAIAMLMLVSGGWALIHRGISSNTEAPSCHQELK